MTYTAQYPATPGGTPPARKRSIALPIIGGLILAASVVIGLLLLTAFGSISKSKRIDAFGRFFVDGGTEAEVDIKKSGLYTIYYEYVGEVEADGDSETIDAPADP